MKARRPIDPALDRSPLSEVLDAQIDEPRIRRVWRGVEPRVVGARGAGGDRRVVIVAGVAFALLVTAVLVLRPAAAPARFLALADGGAPAALTADEAAIVVFADGSRIELEAGAEIVPTLNDVDDFSLSLTRGVARVAVTPGGPRRWHFDCGLAIVEVVGTEFRLERSDEGLRVSVEHGHVRVTARDERTWDLFAHDDVWIAPQAASLADATPRAVAPPSPVPPAVEEVAPAAPRIVRDDVGAAPHASRWTELAESGAYERAYDVLGEEGGASREVAIAGPRELLLLADVARLSGHPAEAVEPLERLVSQHPDAPEAPLAAVVLGRVQQDALRAPAEAARAFERAEALGVPASLAADVRGRLALAYLAVGDPRGPDAARRYLAEHPDGPHASALAAHLE